MALLLLMLLPSNGTPLNIQTNHIERLPQFSTISENGDNSDISVRTRNSLLEVTKEVIVRSATTTVTSPQNDSPVVSKCSECNINKSAPPVTSDGDKEVLRQLRLEMVKAQILAKLNLDAPPSIPRGRVVPEGILENYVAEDVAPRSQRTPTSNIIVANRREYLLLLFTALSQCYEILIRYIKLH